MFLAKETLLWKFGKKVSGEVGVSFLAQQSWIDRVQLWFARATRQSQIGILRGLIPVAVI